MGTTHRHCWVSGAPNLPVYRGVGHCELVKLTMIVAGQISASLSAMARTIDDYDSMTKREIIKAKQEKAQMYAHLARPA